MTRTDIDTSHFKKLLNDELTRLETELSTLGQHNEKSGDWEATPGETEDSADPNERADKFEEYEDRAAILNQLEAQYTDVKVALDKIEGGSYGICEVSGEPIEVARLEANPAARTCTAHMNG